MNYTKIYDQLVVRGRERVLGKGVYKERHHIIPRCLGGSNKKDNLVYFTTREHFIAHLLLCKMYPEHEGLGFAAFRMSYKKGLKINSRLFEKLKIRFSKTQSDKMLGNTYGSMRRKGISPTKGKKRSEESKRKQSERMKGRIPWNKGVPQTEEHRRKNSDGHKGKKRSEESRRKQGEKLRGRKHSEERCKKNSDARKAYWARKKAEKDTCLL